MTDKTDQNPTISRSTIRYFFFIFLVTGTLIAGTTAVVYNSRTNQFVTSLAAQETTKIAQQRIAMNESTASVKGDLLFLARLDNLLAFVDTGSATALASVKQDYFSFCSTRAMYDQIRFLAASGHEVVRVNYNDGYPALVPTDQLQNKHDRPYFQKALPLKKDHFYISALDLNVENGAVEIPFKPMLRVATPVQDSMGRTKGVVVLNLLAESIFQRVVAVGATEESETQVLNREGYWLYSPTPEKRWGFMLPERAEASFAREHAAAWRIISSQEEGQITLPGQGMYTFTTLHPGEMQARLTETQSALGTPVAAERHWKLVSHVSSASIQQYENALMGQLFLLGATLFLLAATISWQIAMTMARRRERQQRLESMALYDALTNLPNRRLFTERMALALTNASRYKRKAALLYIDLDGFKQVNDTLGHDAGDALLRQVADRFSMCCRMTDTLARLGGDEFAILLSEVEGGEGAATVAQKLLSSLAPPFVLSEGEARVGASIGIALYPDHAADSETLTKLADEAMYASKHAGKNRFTFATP